MLTLWLFVALQTLSPFIHAHADGVQLDRGGWLHMHSGVDSDVAHHALVSHEPGAEVSVAQGMPMRDAALAAAADVLPAGGVTLPRTLETSRPGPGRPAPACRPTHSDHLLPRILAPPAV